METVPHVGGQTTGRLPDDKGQKPRPEPTRPDRPLARHPRSLPASRSKPMNPQDWKLILLALIAITALIVLITRAKVNAFLSLLMASLAVGLGAVMLLGVPARDATGKVLAAAGDGKVATYTVLGVMKSFSDGLGATLAGTAGVIALGTMLGKLLAESGGAEVLAASPVAGLPGVALPAMGCGHGALDPLGMVLGFYRWVEALARAKGLDPDRPSRLAKVTRTV